MVRKFIDLILHRHKPTWVERHSIVLLTFAAMAAMGISLSIGLMQSVWFDEAYSIIVAKQDVGQLLHLVAVDTHPPLYYLLLKAWAAVFGWSELALRSLSVLAMGGAVVFAGLLVRRLFGARAALITLLFVIFAPFLLRYGFEIRMYSLASLIGIAATYVLIVATQTKEKQKQWKLYALYALLVALGVYTLYYTVLLWIAHLIWLFYMTRRAKQPILKAPWLGAFILSGILFLPWLPAFVSQIGNGALANIAQALTIENLLGIVSFTFMNQPAWQLNGFMFLLVIGVIVTVTAFAMRAYKIVSVKERSYLSLFALYFLVPVTILALVSLVRPMYVERYLSHVLIGASIFVGLIIVIVTAKRPNKKVLAASVGLLLVMCVGIGNLSQSGNYNFQRLQKPSIKAAAATLPNCDRNKTILADEPYAAIELSYYLPSCEIHFMSDTASLGGGYAPLSNSPLHVFDPEKELAGSKYISYVYYGVPKLTMPPGLREVSTQDFDAMHIKTFVAK